MTAQKSRTIPAAARVDGAFAANPFVNPSVQNFAAPRSISAKQIHKCPACLQPWFDANGKFNACVLCPYRIPPRPISVSGAPDTGAST